MLWNTNEIDTYIQQKQYVDTVIIPLIPVSFSDTIRQTAVQSEFLTVLTTLLERQFKGRLLLTPAFTYLEQGARMEHLKSVNSWIEQSKKNGSQHVFVITSDPSWKEIENEIEADLIWHPTIPLEHMEEKYKRSIMEDQVKQLIQIIVHKWQKA